MKQDIRPVTIEWEGPFTLGHVIASKKDEDEDLGLYQIYDYCISSKTEKLLYIGKAEYWTFGDRLRQHRDESKWLREVERVLVRIGRIARADYKDERHTDWPDWRKLLQNVEALQIYWHSPPRNLKCTKTYNRPPLYVVNKGKRGSLEAEYGYPKV